MRWLTGGGLDGCCRGAQGEEEEANADGEVPSLFLIDGEAVDRDERPPHVPELPEVAVSPFQEHWWARNGGLKVEAALASHCVALLSARWLVGLARSGGALVPRQALPSAAFVATSAVKASTDSELPIVCVSHCWLQADHPDPSRHNLQVLAKALQLFGHAKDKDWSVFLDFASLHQYCRDSAGVPREQVFEWLDKEARFADGAIGRFGSEELLFREALGHVGSLYAHPHTFVFMLTGHPPDAVKTSSKLNASGKAFFDRGWCYCESTWACMIKDTTHLLDLGRDGVMEAASRSDLQDLASVSLRPPPLLPVGFRAQLERKRFSRGRRDSYLVSELYFSTFADVFRDASDLFYKGQRWGPDEATAVSEVLASGVCSELQRLSLDCNRLGDAGALALAKGFSRGGTPKLWRLGLADNGIGDRGARAIAGALEHLPSLRFLCLVGNKITKEGWTALRAAATKRNVLVGGMG